MELAAGVTGTEVLEKCEVWTLDPDVEVGPQVESPEVPSCGVVVDCGVTTLNPDVEVGSVVVDSEIPGCGVRVCWDI